MDILTWCVAAISLLLGSWIQTALGFGMAVIAAPIIIIFQPNWVPVVITITALFLSLINTWDQRLSLELKSLITPFISRIPGTILGAWLLSQLSIFWMQISVALCVFLAVIVSYFGTQFAYTPKRLALAAFASGITGTTTSIGGPPMALVMQHGNPKTVRANLSLYFSYSCIVSLIAYAYMGLLNSEIFYSAISFLPVCLLGFVSGKKARNYVDAGRFRPLLLLLCSVSAGIAFIGAIIKY